MKWLVDLVIELLPEGALVPSGTIAMWYHWMQDVPDGWVFCNGENGTPDLRDKFVLGAGLSHGSGDTGGSETHDHTVNASNTGTPLAAGSDLGSSGKRSNITSPIIVVGSTDEVNHEPPWWALIYMMKT